MTEYNDFLRAKADFEKNYGQPVTAGAVNPLLKEHQRDIVRWAVEGGRRAIFAAFGLGKSMMQIETLRLTLAQAGGSGLIIAPLGVRGEFVRDGGKLDVEIKFIRSVKDMTFHGGGLYITNYETVRDGKLDPNIFTAVSLDEAGVLRSFGSKTYQTFLRLFEKVKYRFVATATPSPNRYKELIHYAGFLGVMDTGQALTRFFQRDSTQANNLTIYEHKREEFFMWLNSWSIFLQKPSDLGYSDEGYNLPPLTVEWHSVGVDHSTAAVDRDGQARLFRGGVKDLQGAAKEKRDSLPTRIDKLMTIVREHREADGSQIILWCDLNDEQTAIERALAAEGITYSSVHGSLDPDTAEDRIDAWRDKETWALIGKPVQLGQGLNFQQAHTAVFAGVTFKFNDTFQAWHRIQRFGQEHPCTIHMVHAESETEVVQSLKDKWAQHKELTNTMTEIIKKYGLSRNSITEALTRSMGIERMEARGEGWTLANNDCVDETTNHMDENSVDLIVTSIPFSNHYEYTPSYNDFGHTDDNAHFWEQMDFLTPQLLRVLKPGRIYACHVKDRINFGNVTGAGIPTVSPFHAEALFHGTKHGFDYMGMITVVTDVVRENNQTYRLGYTEMRKDGTKMGVGSPEYILLFHKPQTDRSKGYADDRVTKEVEDYSLARWQVDAHANWRSSGERHLTADELAALPVEQRSRLFTEQTLREVYDYESHVQIGEALQGKGALPATFMSLMPGSWAPDVWHDINRMLTLNGEQKRRNVQMHVCPLQFDIVDRLIDRYSNPGDLVFDPFGGLGTVPLRALKLGRQGRSSELNPGYFLDSVKYLEAEERQREMPTLFDLEEVPQAS
ncbi:SNF2 family N-terminal domain-containing protein [Arthrobacter sp. yr096]|uniref:DNA methyltransferase n=1 Tax=Arthrobacter sp. yr096 TaxID=1761750 RepID=UPI0008D7BE3A|nr:DNA methyltransferase [Arthrobacter sp. yr096]SEI45414.1 SNF2 family N-terminal domain-containing protein [Arthrobacter sp. yr096]